VGSTQRHFLSFTLTWVGVITIPTFHDSPHFLAAALRSRRWDSKVRAAHRSPLSPTIARTHGDAQRWSTATCAARARLPFRTQLPAPASRAAHPTKCAGLCGVAHKKQWVPHARGRGGGTRRLRRAATACAGRAFSPRDTPVCPRTALTAAHGPPCAAHHPPETPRHSRAAPALPQQSTRACGV
jgi:hypothetical protein